MSATDCYCRGAAICEDCRGHRCTNQCTCPEIDGAPQYIYPSQTIPKPAGVRT